MKRLAIGVILGFTLGAAAVALAASSRFAYLNKGDSAIANGGETVCKATPHAGSRLGFVCQVGGDYRARYGVIINEKEAAITQFSSFNRYRVVVHRKQSPLP